MLASITFVLAIGAGVASKERTMRMLSTIAVLSVNVSVAASIAMTGAAPANVSAIWERPSHRIEAVAASQAINAHPRVAPGMADVAVDGRGDADGYHVRIASAAGGYSWRDVAVIRPADLDPGSWYGYQCVTGDGAFAAVAVLPGDMINTNVARDHGAFAYSVDLRSGQVRALASGVGLKYHSPQCGLSDNAVFTSNPGSDQRTTVATSFNLSSGKQTATSIVAGQVTSVVPTAEGLIGALGASLVTLGGGGSIATPGQAHQLASLGGGAYDLRASSDGGVDLLWQDANSKVTIAHESKGHLSTLGHGEATKTHLFAGKGGHTLVSGALDVSGGVTPVDTAGLPNGAELLTLDGSASFGEDAAPAVGKAGDKASQSELATAAGYPLIEVTKTKAVSRSKGSSASAVRSWGSTGPSAPGGGVGRHDSAQLPPTETKRTAFIGVGPVTPTISAAIAIQPALSPGAATPKCGVARLQPTLQAMQPSNAQVDWATQMAEQNLLTGSTYTRPANYANMGLVAYAPNSDFAPTSLLHPSTDNWSTVPRSVMDAIESQESNFNQASWHALPSIAGDPLIADYYGAGNTITTINYPNADCGYGVAQVTTGMAATDTSITQHGKMKVAVDYQENIAAGLTILEKTWNQLYTAGITANNADPRYLENWFLAAWAYNTGVQPTAAFGNTTGCTPAPTCTGPDGTWGLGWSNNPRNPDYDPSRPPYLKLTYADAAHPSSWPYEERVFGWMASPLIRYGYIAFSKPDYHGGNTWMQIPGVNTFCDLTDNNCDPTNATGGYCKYADSECWWHQPVTWVSNCATTCATAEYQDGAGSTEPTHADPYPPTCNQDTSKVPSGAIIVDDLATPSQNLHCSGMNWSNNGTFSYAPGTNSSGDPIGNIDTHQLGSGFGGHIFFTHTEPASSTSLINTGTWTPNLPSLQYYKIKIHLPASGATATDVVYTIHPGGGASPWNIRVNQDWKSEQWVTIGTFAMQNGGNVQLTNTSSMKAGGYDVAFDAIAFVPMGGTPGTPIGGPPGIQDAPKGSNPAWVNCGCVRRTAGDPVDTATGYFGESQTDLSTPGLGEALQLTRDYAASLADPSGPSGANAVNGAFGHGWTFSYGMTASTDASGNVAVHQEDGSTVSFTNNSGTYTAVAPRFDATLTKSGSSYVYTRHGSDQYTFDTTTGRLQSISDLAGRVASTPYSTTLAYNGSGNLSTVTDPGGRTYTFTWTGTHITKVVSSAGQEVDYAYSAAGDLTDVYGVGTTRTGGTLSDDDHAQYGYNSSHLMTSERTPANYGKAGSPTPVTTNTYDSSERVTQQTDPLGHTTTFTYGPDSGTGIVAGQTLVTDPAGHKTLYTYQSGLLTSMTNGYGATGAATTSYAYDPVTLGVSVQTNPDGSTLTYAYDDAGHLVSSSDGLGRATSYQYDATGQLLEKTDPTGLQTITTYNTAEEPTSVMETLQGASAESVYNTLNPSYSRATSYAYNDAAHPSEATSFTDANSHATTYAYDGFGDLTSETDAASNTTKFGYDTSRGWKTSMVTTRGVAAGVTPTCTPPAVGCTTYAHDPYGHVITTTDPLGHTTQATYDADGNQLTSTDANGHTTTTTYDAAGEATAVKKPSGDTNTTTYNPDGTVAATVDAASNSTSYTYDALGRVVSTTNPDSKTTSYTYDAMGRLLTTTKPNGDTATQAWDAAGQLTGITYSGTSTPAVSYTYDSGGHRATMADGTGNWTYQYDVFGEPTSITTGSGATTAYTYDAAGNTTSIGYPMTGTTITRAFNALEQLASITDPTNGVTSFGYNPDGAPTTTAFPNGTVSTVAYDNADRPTSSALTKGATGLGTITYTHDNLGDITGTTPSNGAPGTATTYGYNSNQYLTGATASGTTTGYGYDKVGNPTTLGAATQVFDPAGQLCWSTTGSVSSPTCGSPASGATTYGYDANGDRTSTTTASGSTNYGFNAAGEMTSVGGATTAAYTYDGDGLRATKTTGGTTSAFTWDARGKVPELLSDGTTDYVYGPTGAPIEQFNASGVNALYYFCDAHGSTVELTNTSGAVVGNYTYTAWGGVATHTGTSTPFEFAAAYADPETGFLFLQARYYDPASAVFVSVDPVVSKTLTAYLYTGNDPLNRADPLGLLWGAVCVGVSAMGAVGAGVGGSAEACIGLSSGSGLFVSGSWAAVAGIGVYGDAGFFAGLAGGTGSKASDIAGRTCNTTTAGGGSVFGASFTGSGPCNGPDNAWELDLSLGADAGAFAGLGAMVSCVWAPFAGYAGCGPSDQASSAHARQSGRTNSSVGTSIALTRGRTRYCG